MKRALDRGESCTHQGFTVSEINGFVAAWTWPNDCSELLVTGTAPWLTTSAFRETAVAEAPMSLSHYVSLASPRLASNAPAS